MENPSLASALLEQLAGDFTQDRRILRLSTRAGDRVLLAECMRGDEEISRGFRFEVDALSLDASIPLRSLIGQPVLLELLTAEGIDSLRPFHGHILAAESKGANGGFARYQIVIEPWLSFLGTGRDSRIFQDMSVFDILDTVFRAYQGQGRLAPAWRFDILDRSIYPVRSITTQYQESDLAFAERLMSEEGLFYFFEHEGSRESSTLGSHTLVIADHNGAFRPNAQPHVRFTQSGAVMKEDSLDRWRTETCLQTNAIELRTWDYRVCQVREASSLGQQSDLLVSRDVPGAYAFPTREQALRIADNQMEALEARNEVHTGAGTVRTFAPGTTFTLHEHSIYDGGKDATFAIVRVRHLAHNNLSADTGNAVSRLLGSSSLQDANRRDLESSLHLRRSDLGARPVYRNTIDAIHKGVPFRPLREDGQGRQLHPWPLVHGQQTAIVVGPPGAVIHTDRDHRIKVQFHWQRGDGSHSRLLHPAPDGHTGAPADDRAGVWIRVATPLGPVAGANWGSHALPRVGQEVLVDFIEGNIDRPVVIGTLYNGAGRKDAQHNQMAYGAGAVTGNAPMWFPGSSAGHAHPAVLSGIKSQAMRTSQSGVGAFSQLVFDDTPHESRLGLQCHASPHQGTAELNLGHLRHQSDNEQLETVGFGAELKTEHSLALRAGRGLLLSSDKASTADAQLESRAAADQVKQAAGLQVSLAETARKHRASLPGEADPDELPALRELRHTADVLEGSQSGTGHASGGHGSATAYTDPLIQLSSPAGIAAATPASAVICAGSTSSMSAGADINLAAQGGLFQTVKSGISLFTYGKASNANKPNQETGIRLHAAAGKVSSQSQDGPTSLTADKTITVASVTKSVRVAGRKHVLLTAQGAYLKLSGGDIEVHAPGKVDFKATKKELGGPVSSVVATPRLPKSTQLVLSDKPVFSQQFDLSHLAGNDGQIGFGSSSLPYRVYDKSGKFLAQGMTDENGVTDRIFTNEQIELVLLAGDGGWQVEEYYENDDAGEAAGDEELP